MNWRAWLAAAAILLAVVGAFLAGRFSRDAGEPQQAVNTSTAADRRAIRDRVVLPHSATTSIAPSARWWSW